MAHEHEKAGMQNAVALTAQWTRAVAAGHPPSGELADEIARGDDVRETLKGLAGIAGVMVERFAVQNGLTLERVLDEIAAGPAGGSFEEGD